MLNSIFYLIRNKTRKIFHTSIFRDDEVLKVGDSAVFLSTSRPDRYVPKSQETKTHLVLFCSKVDCIFVSLFSIGGFCQII